jgi:apolipoprotein N-acyltransferase
MKKVATSALLLILAVFVTGTLITLAMPLGEKGSLILVALVPLLYATKEKGAIAGFLGGLGAIFWFAFLTTTGWFYQIKHLEPSSGWNYTACGLYAFVFAIFFAIWADGKNSERPTWWLAAIAVALESFLLTQIPAHLGLALYRAQLMKILAEIGGIWLVSYAAWLANLWVVRTRYGWGYGVVIIVLICGASIGNKVTEPFPEDRRGELVAAIAQFQDGNEDAMEAATKRLNSGTPFVVWPEFGGIMFAPRGDTTKLKELSKNTPAIITSFPDNHAPLPYNVASLTSKGQESERYQKRKLFAGEKNMHTPGSKAGAVPFAPAEGSVGLNICFDSCYPSVIRETAALPGVKVIALPTIDPESKNHFVAAMHAAYTPFRAAESGVSIIRADGRFGSMFVNQYGTIESELKDGQATAYGWLQTNRRWTLYQTLGDWWLYLSWLVAIGYPISQALAKRKLAPIQNESERVLKDQ